MNLNAPAAETVGATLGRAHWQRLRHVYRSAGWPCLDNLEIELLAAGLLERIMPPSGVEYLRVSDAGIRALAVQLARNRGARSAHEALVARVAAAQVQAGRLCYCGPGLRARPGDRWLQVRPDVYSIRATTVAEYLFPVVHEIKVRRADLLADLKKPDKRAGYRCVASQCYYVLAAGIAEADEIPPECGVIFADEQRLELIRGAPLRPVSLGFDAWMALARATPYRPFSEPAPAL